MQTDKREIKCKSTFITFAPCDARYLLIIIKEFSSVSYYIHALNLNGTIEQQY